MSAGDAHLNDLDELLAALDEADAAGPALYRQLSGDPDLAVAHEARLKELHAKRLELAQHVGLAALDHRRAKAAVVPATPAHPPETAPSISHAEPASAPVIYCEPEADAPRSEPVLVATNSIAKQAASDTKGDMMDVLRFALRLALDLVRPRAQLVAETPYSDSSSSWRSGRSWVASDGPPGSVGPWASPHA